MTDAKLVADRYVALWNEQDAANRQKMLAENWAADAIYVDPLMAGRGTAEIDGLISAVQKRFPNFRFNLIGKPDGHGENVRFSWSLGPGDYIDAPIEGTDIAVVRDGRIHSITGFLDKVPVA
ncbi:MAG TPA: nuclear transport factor 2 family protein [Devosiaceae bacterium]|nr:nuclear transport factor 2 family protein [Devosiaceae bacterium]